MVSVVRPDIVTSLRQAGTLRHYRRLVRDRVDAEPALRLLPGLLDLPLFSSEQVSLLDLMATTPLLALCGPAGSGRSLAILQGAWQWVIHQHPDPLVLLVLDQIDDATQPPWTVIQHQFTLADAVHAADRRGSADTPCMLLIDGWETLPTERQIVWRDCLLSLPRFWPEIHVAVVLPETETGDAWPAFQFVAMAPPDETMQRRWMLHLLPDASIEPLLDALRPGTRQVVALPRLIHVAMLCLLATTSQFPDSLRQMYDNAWQSFEQYHSRRRKPLLITHGSSDQDKTLMIGAAARQWYTLAQAIAADGNLDQLAVPGTPDRSEVAVLLVSLLADPEPVYQALWGADPVRPADALTLGRCLALQPSAAPVWSLHLLTVLTSRADLALTARMQGSPFPGSDHLHRQLLRQFVPHLADLLTHHGHILPTDVAGQLLVHLAPMLGTTRLLELLDNQAIHPNVRWVSAEVLRQMPPNVVWRIAEFLHPPDALAQVARCYLLAFDDLAARQSLGREPVVDWIAALGHADIDPQWRTQVIRAFFDQPQIPLGAQLAIIRAVPDIDSQAAWQVLLHACLSTNVLDRQAALGMLHSYAPSRALLLLEKILFAEKLDCAIQQDALECLVTYSTSDAMLLLARCAIVSHLPLVARLRAMERLAQQRAGSAILFRRLLVSPTMHPVIRAMAARLLAQQSTDAVLHELAMLAASDAPVLVRRETITAIEKLGRMPELATPARIELGVLLRQVYTIPPLIVRIVQALGSIGAAESITWLGPLLEDGFSLHLRTGWLAAAPHLADIPVAQWSVADLPATVRPALITALAQGMTSADHPGDLDDLVMRIAEQVRCAAAAALSRIGQREGGTDRQVIADMLFRALCRGTPGTGSAALLYSLAELYENDGRLTLFNQLLADTRIDPQICWLAIDLFGREPAVAAYLLAYLERGQANAFINSNIVRVLAEADVPGDLPVYYRLITQAEQPVHLRIQAVKALGQSGSTASETSLLSIMVDDNIPLAVRAAAATVLPAVLMSATHARLHDILEHERFPVEVTAGIIDALGRMRDKASLPLLLRYIRHDSPMVAIAALQALGMLGEAHVSAELVELTQRTTTDQRVRLQAVGTLLHLCGAEHTQLMRPYLSSPNLPLRLRAFELLLEACPDAANLETIIADTNLPLAIRLRAVEAAAHLLDNRLLANLLLAVPLDAEVGIQVALIFGQRATPDVIDTLAECVCSGRAVLRIRYYCIKLLATYWQHPGPLATHAGLALSRIATDPTQPAEQREWAMEAFFADDMMGRERNDQNHGC